MRDVTVAGCPEVWGSPEQSGPLFSTPLILLASPSSVWRLAAALPTSLDALGAKGAQLWGGCGLHCE